MCGGRPAVVTPSFYPWDRMAEPDGLLFGSRMDQSGRRRGIMHPGCALFHFVCLRFWSLRTAREPNIPVRHVCRSGLGRGPRRDGRRARAAVIGRAPSRGLLFAVNRCVSSLYPSADKGPRPMLLIFGFGSFGSMPRQVSGQAA